MEYTHTKEEETQTPITQDDYRTQVSELRDQAITYFDHLLKIDLKSPKDIHKGQELTQKLLSSLSSLSKNYRVPITQPNSPNQDNPPKSPIREERALSLEPLSISIDLQTVKKHKGSLSLKDPQGHIAFKNSKSYMIGPFMGKFTVMENGASIFSSGVKGRNFPILADLAYIKPLDCYLLNISGQVYRKDINNLSPYLFLDVSCGEGMYYSERHRTLFINKDGKGIAGFNIDN